MSLFSIKDIKLLLRERGVPLKKRLGQHFLISRWVASKILDFSDIQKQDVVLEVGSGFGNLTRELAKRAKKVVAVEKDPQMIELLKENAKEFKNIEIVHGDILKLSTKSYKIQDTKYKLVGNLPYYITYPVIRKFLEERSRPKLMVMMVQKEVAQRICAKDKMSLPSLMVQFYGKAKIMGYVKKDSFWPQPKVDSAILLIEPNKTAPKINANKFFKLVRAGFASPRKTILNNLSSGLKLDKEGVKGLLSKEGINPIKRPENLSLDDWLGVFKTFRIN